MQKKIFTIPAIGSEDMIEEMNAFLRGQKVLGAEQQILQQNGMTYWTFCITYLPSSYATAKGESVDYKKQLTDTQFKWFARFREIRKEMSQKEAIPAYSVFTDKELSAIAILAEKKELTDTSMRKINGISEKRVEKYGQTLIAACEAICGE